MADNAKQVVERSEWSDWASRMADRAEAQAEFEEERERYLKHAHRQSFIEREPHTEAGMRADILKRAAGYRLAVSLTDQEGAVEMKRMARRELSKLRAHPEMQEKSMAEPVQHAKHELHKARAERQERAADFWQRTIEHGRPLRQEAARQEATEKPRQPKA